MRDSQLLTIKQRFGIIGNAPALTHAIQVAMQVAPTDMTVLITGESGSGKESFSKIIHSLSARKHGPFIAVNCGAIPEGTIDSELFGHEKGAFTGAHDSRKGYFETTNKGTIFLDEIGEMPMGTQARLLRVLENGEYIKVGSSKVHKTDVRVIAATNVNLLDAVEKGTFREDLYYRLSTVPIKVPPLRDRGLDIELLFRKFSSDFAEKYHVESIQLTTDAEDLLLSYPFPGNIRQLKNIAEQVSALEMDRTIDRVTLSKYLPDQRANRLPALYQGKEGKEEFSERDLLYKILFDMKRDMSEMKKLIFDAVQHGNISPEILKEHSSLFSDVPEKPAPESSPAPAKQPLYLEAGQPQHEESHAFDISPVEDVNHEEEVESLSLEDHEKELIIKALKKHKNRRKRAAKDLGISERTLYRKIKQYEIG